MCRQQIALIAAVFIMAGCIPESARKSDAGVMTGWVQPSVFMKDSGHASFRERYDTVTVDTNLTGMIRQLSAGVEVLVFYGQWCSDSRRDVPHFLRIVEAAAWEPRQMRFYALDRTKESSDGLTEKYSIQLLPTFIFSNGSQEIGRIVESPQTTLEGDMVKILLTQAH
jgi:thiol-disulfide isomerase/thioredoxin